MTPTDAVQIIVAVATLVASFAGLVTAIRSQQTASRTHDLVNGITARATVLERREARAEGYAAASGALEPNAQTPGAAPVPPRAFQNVPAEASPATPPDAA